MHRDDQGGYRMRQVMTGNYASAYGAKLSRAEVIAAYPITPQTSIVEKLAELVSTGELKAKFISVESEHSAMAACISASIVGARTYTATSSHGLTLMHEVLMWASGARLPIVITNVSRAMAPPWSVWADHMDSIAQRDTGWLQFFCSSNQEVLDTTIMAYKICESRNVMLPAMVIEDAFILSHTSEPVDMPEQEAVDSFLPSFSPELKVEIGKPMGFGSLVKPDQYMEFRYKAMLAMKAARERILRVEKEFKQVFGREYGGLLENYRCDDAEVVLVAAGSTAATAKDVVDSLREKGQKVGLARLRVFRPFPHEEFRALASKVAGIAVLDRSYTFGVSGAFFTEIKGSIYDCPKRPAMKNYIAGLGGRDITPKILEKIFDDIQLFVKRREETDVEWVDVAGLPRRWH
ncbi:MAG: pyruvate ferredoxin oxidoreductase [Candidatus Thermoplasmatota archaeon]|nr:pyruvate ferredoxin oxidoreductase [Candidatus Thermoplasmatota archaeon]